MHIYESDKIGLSEIALSAITVMELFQGMDKNELAQMKENRLWMLFRLTTPYLKEQLSLSKNTTQPRLTNPGRMIGATAIVYQIPLYTYNVRDFDFLPGVVLYQPDK